MEEVTFELDLRERNQPVQEWSRLWNISEVLTSGLQLIHILCPTHGMLCGVFFFCVFNGILGANRKV